MSTWHDLGLKCHMAKCDWLRYENDPCLGWGIWWKTKILVNEWLLGWVYLGLFWEVNRNPTRRDESSSIISKRNKCLTWSLLLGGGGHLYIGNPMCERYVSLCVSIWVTINLSKYLEILVYWLYYRSALSVDKQPS